MKSIAWAALAGMIALAGCKQAPSYTITGTVADPAMEGKKVKLYIGEYVPEQQPRVDSAVVSGGRYEFKGTVSGPEQAYVAVDADDRTSFVGAYLALDNAAITVSTDTAGVTRIGGTLDNDRYQAYQDSRAKSSEELMVVIDSLRRGQAADTLAPEEEKRMQDEWETRLSRMREAEFQFVKENIDNPAIWSYDFYNCATTQPLERKKELLALAGDALKQTQTYKKIADRVEKLEKTAVGQPFTDLRMTDPEGKEIALSDYAGKGKIVLVDFWASWCGPCRAEMPNVVKAYNRFKDKGFEIVGVSFDRNKEAWLKGIKDLGLPWPQMSDVKGWDSEGAKAYAISGIPHTVLIDKDGTILARDLRAEELQAKLAELLDK